jgi:hypothetical protein
MKSHHFNFMGASRSYWDFHLGYGLFTSVNLLVQTVLFWQLASAVKSNPQSVRPIIALFSVCFLLLAVLSARYFFIAPAVFEAAIAICLALAWVTARPGTSA